MTGPPERCPVCGKAAEPDYRPFCSRRCADVDLGRWFNEDYRIPAEETPDGADGDSADEPAKDSAGEAGDGAGKERRGVLAHSGAAGGLAETTNL